jgi:hypothetical protein
MTDSVWGFEMVACSGVLCADCAKQVQILELQAGYFPGGICLSSIVDPRSSRIRLKKANLQERCATMRMDGASGAYFVPRTEVH